VQEDDDGFRQCSAGTEHARLLTAGRRVAAASQHAVHSHGQSSGAAAAVAAPRRCAGISAVSQPGESAGLSCAAEMEEERGESYPGVDTQHTSASIGGQCAGPLLHGAMTAAVPTSLEALKGSLTALLPQHTPTTGPQTPAAAPSALSHFPACARRTTSSIYSPLRPPAALLHGPGLCRTAPRDRPLDETLTMFSQWPEVPQPAPCTYPPPWQPVIALNRICTGRLSLATTSGTRNEELVPSNRCSYPSSCIPTCGPSPTSVHIAALSEWPPPRSCTDSRATAALYNGVCMHQGLCVLPAVQEGLIRSSLCTTAATAQRSSLSQSGDSAPCRYQSTLQPAKLGTGGHVRASKTEGWMLRHAHSDSGRPSGPVRAFASLRPGRLC
jgi:hypothetical protein